MNRNYLLDTPQYALSNLPQPKDFNGDIAAYLAAIQKAYESDPNQSQPAYAAPGEFTTPDGQHMSSAGYHLDKSANELAADAYNRILERTRFSQVKGPGVGLTAMSRMGVRPEEAQQAFDAYGLGPSGLPEAQLAIYMQNLMEAGGMRPSHGPGAPGGMPGTQTPGGSGPQNSGPGVVPGPKGKPVDAGEVGGQKPSGDQPFSLGPNDGLMHAYESILGGQQMSNPPPKTPVDSSTPWAMSPDSANPLMGGGGPGVGGTHEYPPGLLAALHNHRSPQKAGY